MFESFNHDRKRSIIALLVQMATADTTLQPIEEQFIYDVGKQLFLTEDEVSEIAQHPDQYQLVPPPGEQERMTILYYLLFTMRADGQVHQQEENLCYKAGLRLGFNPQLTRDLIQVMKQYLVEEIPPDAMLSMVRKYLN